MSSNVINKANIQPIPTDRYSISSSDVIKYLQDQLGVPVAYDFTRWTGVTVDQSYVRMRVVFNPDDIMAKNTAGDYVDRVLADNAAGIKFQDRIINTLKPFMYPEEMHNIGNNPELLQKLCKIGLYNERLSEILQFSKLNYCKEANVFRVYLRAERIIADMLADPATNAIDGEMSILTVHGTTSETIRWEVAVSKNKSAFAGSSNISFDAIFNRV
jgi:hypothetical protein